MPKISVVIRDLNKKPLSLNSIPKDDNIEIIVSNWKAPDFSEKTTSSKLVEGMAVARNDGAMMSTGDILVFMDGDLEFTPEFFYETVALCKPGVVIGLDNPWQHFIIGRYIVITREDFFHAGGVDPHMFYHEDMSFSYKLESMGYKLIKVPQDIVKTLDESPSRKDKRYYTMKNFMALLRIQLVLALLYPKLHHPARLARNLLDFWWEAYLVRGNKLNKDGTRKS